MIHFKTLVEYCRKHEVVRVVSIKIFDLDGKLAWTVRPATALAVKASVCMADMLLGTGESYPNPKIILEFIRTTEACGCKVHHVYGKSYSFEDTESIRSNFGNFALMFGPPGLLSDEKFRSEISQALFNIALDAPDTEDTQTVWVVSWESGEKVHESEYEATKDFEDRQRSGKYKDLKLSRALMTKRDFSPPDVGSN